jgi:lipopolysaccharide/colanic/teichoic acid biosynthesis glycosyltransferase
MGRDGRHFRIFKMRSMHLNAEEKGPGWTIDNDPRFLRIGYWMRKWNLDEIPQFWNVLLGDMSLVGPRPERPEHIAHFKEQIAHYNARHFVLPGLTGWAQIHGFRGNTNVEQRLQYDLYYLENWSIWLDFYIMAATLMQSARDI